MAALNWYIFRKKSGRLSSTGSRILSFGSHCSANFQPVLDYFIPKFKLEYDNLENIKTDCVNTVVFNLHQIKRLIFFLGHPVHMCKREGTRCPPNKSFLTLSWNIYLKRYLFSKNQVKDMYEVKVFH